MDRNNRGLSLPRMIKAELPNSERLAWLEQLDRVAALAKLSTMERVVRLGLKYVRLWQSRLLGARAAQASLFTGVPFNMQLPAAADIYLCGGKTHDSELRLARFILRYLPVDASVLDIGGHYGYFTLLMAQVAKEGYVRTIEAAPASQVFLKQNTAPFTNIRCYSMGLSDTRGTMTFYTFPAAYSEYNTLDITPYLEQAWFIKNPPKKETVSVNTLDGFVAEHAPSVQWIKMDVEGAEALILKGGALTLASNCVWMMEYLAGSTSATYQQAEAMFRAAGYLAYAITSLGDLTELPSVLDWMLAEGLESENIVFIQS